jgi:acyl-CoA synthetase (AMP-forming)/AMP-acid ligase II
MLFDNEYQPVSRPAIHDAALGKWCTYGELRDVVERLAQSLVYPQKALAFCFTRNDLASVAWYLAALQAGHAVALLDEGLTKEFKAALISSYTPDFILASVDTTDYASAFEEQPGYSSASMPEPRNYSWRRKEVLEQTIHPDLSVLLSTSGSTGSPKFVRLSRKNVLSNALSISQVLEIGEEDRAISSLPFHYSYGLSVLNTHLLKGASEVMTDEGLTSPVFWKAFRETECTSFAGVPYSYQILKRLDVDKLNLPSLRVMTQAGGRLHKDLIAHFHQVMAARSGRFFVMYGQTEATARIAILPSQFLPEKLGSAGRAIPGGSLAVRTEGRLTTEPNQVGELVYTGPNVMMGYANNREDLSLGDALGGTLETGDSAQIDEEGFIFFEGRMKRDAKVFGLRVNLDEVENLLRVYGPTAVVAGGENLQIYCEYGEAEDFARYRQDLAAKLRVHHSAFKFHRIEQIPTTSSGKINYPALTAKT